MYRRYFLLELLYCNHFILSTPHNSCRSHIASYCQDLDRDEEVILVWQTVWNFSAVMSVIRALLCSNQIKDLLWSFAASARYPASSSVISNPLKTSWHFACRLSLVSSLYAGWYKEGIVGGRGRTGRGFGRGRWGGIYKSEWQRLAWEFANLQRILFSLLRLVVGWLQPLFCYCYWPQWILFLVWGEQNWCRLCVLVCTKWKKKQRT